LLNPKNCVVEPQWVSPELIKSCRYTCKHTQAKKRSSVPTVQRFIPRKRNLRSTYEPTREKRRSNALSAQTLLQVFQVLSHTCERTQAKNRSSVPTAQRVLARKRILRYTYGSIRVKKPFKCTHCSQAFVGQLSLIQHNRTHTNGFWL